MFLLTIINFSPPFPSQAPPVGVLHPPLQGICPYGGHQWPPLSETSSQVSALILLGPSPARDSVDHSLLPDALSSLPATKLWFPSYLPGSSFSALPLAPLPSPSNGQYLGSVFNLFSNHIHSLGSPSESHLSTDLSKLQGRPDLFPNSKPGRCLMFYMS